jgi:Na+-transporting methylmalonyl-CoA/oxaloacetate decarboxylase gamma subunit
MTLINWLVLFEFLVGLILVVWLISKAFKHAKHSPAEHALRQHLTELELAKENKTEVPANPAETTNAAQKKGKKKQ